MHWRLAPITFNSPPSTTAAPFEFIAANLGIFGTMTAVLFPDGDGHVVEGERKAVWKAGVILGDEVR